MSDPANHRKVYARGLFDGLRKAGVDDPEEFMNQARQKDKENNLSGIQRKIYECTPLKSPWHVSQICSEVYRSTGSRCERRTVDDCLNRLLEMGLVKEFKQGHFMRTETKSVVLEKVEAAPIKEAHVVDIKMARQTEVASKDVLKHECTPREALKVISIGLVNIASQIEEIAEEIDKAEKSNEEKIAKLRQLQELLRGLG